MLKKRIGFIGYKGHAARLIKALDKIDRCKIVYFYHPEKDIELDKISIKEPFRVSTTRRLDDLYSCDAIVISSPNHTHFSYLKKLAKEYKGYIFCEKPPGSNFEELEILERLSNEGKKRIHFNFNLRFSFLKEVLNTFPQAYALGEPIRISIIVGHGLAFKKDYEFSWRANKRLHKSGVLETLGIHYFDLASFLFGMPIDLSCKTETFSPYGDSIDTAHLSCSFINKCYFSLTCSYCIPCTEDIQINYTNGFIVLNAGRIRVFGPRDTFDKNGFFISPPLIYEKSIDENELYLKSLEDSCAYFIDCVCKKQPIDIKYFEQSILSNKVCLNVKNN